MAKRTKGVISARPAQHDDDSLLIRSAESLGRVIGSLQRQLQGIQARAAAVSRDGVSGDGSNARPGVPRDGNLFASPAARAGSNEGRRSKSTKSTRRRAPRRASTQPTTATRKRSSPRAAKKR